MNKGKERPTGYTVLSGNDPELEEFLQRFSKNMAKNGAISEVNVITDIDVPRWVTKTVSKKLFKPIQKSKYGFMKASNKKIKKMLKHYKKMDMFQDAAVKVRPGKNESLVLDVVLRSKESNEVRMDLAGFDGDFGLNFSGKFRNYLDLCEVAQFNCLLSPLSGIRKGGFSLRKPKNNKPNFFTLFANAENLKQEADADLQVLSAGFSIENLKGTRNFQVNYEKKNLMKTGSIYDHIGLNRQALIDETYQGIKLSFSKSGGKRCKNKYSLVDNKKQKRLDIGVSIDLDGKKRDYLDIELEMDHTFDFTKRFPIFKNVGMFDNSEFKVTHRVKGMQPLFKSGYSKLNTIPNNYGQNQWAAFINHEPNQEGDNYQLSTDLRLSLYNSGLISYSDYFHIFGYAHFGVGFNFNSQEMKKRNNGGIGGQYKLSDMLNMEFKLQLLKNRMFDPNLILNFHSSA